MNTQEATPRLKFWSDDFDMDLLKLWPDLPAQLGATGDLKLWTVGHETHGRLNHPAVWNSHGAFVWLKQPNLQRDQHGWFNVHGCVDNAPEIECTWLELLRDQWSHHYNFILLPQMRRFEAPDRRNGLFDRIMYHSRGWKADPKIDQAMGLGFGWVMYQTRQLEGVMKGARA
jgi:hypothetical protein